MSPAPVSEIGHDGISDTHVLDLGSHKPSDEGSEKAPVPPLLSIKSEDHFLAFSDSCSFYMTHGSNYDVADIDTREMVYPPIFLLILLDINALFRSERFPLLRKLRMKK